MFYIPEFLAVSLSFVDKKNVRCTISIPKQGNGIMFTGTGDLFASLFLAHSTLSTDLTVAFERTTASLQSVIENTLKSMSNGKIN